MSTELIAVMTTLPDEASAQKMAQMLVQDRLAACVQWHAIQSFYMWNGQLEQAQEWRLLAKCRACDWPHLQNAIARLHPYQLPAIWYSAITASPDYADWISVQTDRPLQQ
ncbi:MAG: divalent-cation tolerance protein CutA [Tepidimonas sp.]|nr:divalent-cation tolerance protein CutA [Tepidimonas sp.]